MAESDEEIIHEEEEESPAWLTTFADLMSLLLTFFILLLSFSELSQRKFYSVVQSVNKAFKGNPGPSGNTTLNSMERYFLSDKAKKASGQTKKSIDSMFVSQIQDVMQNDLNSQKLSWIKTADGIRITLPADFVFFPESTELKEGAKVILRKIIRKTRHFKFGLIIKTHTDDHPVKNSLFPSNWEFSLRRSTQITRFILNESNIPSSWARAVGYAHSAPMVENTSEINRRMNRRVELEYEVAEIIKDKNKNKNSPRLKYTKPVYKKKLFSPRIFSTPRELK